MFERYIGPIWESILQIDFFYLIQKLHVEVLLKSFSETREDGRKKLNQTLKKYKNLIQRLFNTGYEKKE